MLRRILTAITALSLPVLGAQAQALLDETSTIVAPAAPSAVSREFEVTAAGTYELTLTDFLVPAALTGEKAAILRDGVIVRQLELGTADSASATFDATAGTYTLSIVGTPGAAGVGTLGARVRRGADAPVLELSDTIALPNPPPPPNRQTLDATFAVTDAGDYRVSLADLAFPSALASARLSVIREGGTGLAAQLNAPGTATFAATPGNYRLFVIADADESVAAGVLSTAVRSVATDSTIYRHMLPVGKVELLGSSPLTAGSHSLTAADLAIPAALPALKLAVTSDGRLVARLDAAGNVDFTADTATHELLSASRAATGGSGSFAADVKRGTVSVLSVTGTASDGDASGAVALSGTVPAAGSYRLRLTDFAFPQGFTTLRATVTQGGASVASINAPGTLDVDLQAGTVKVLVFAVANTSTNGIYGVELRQGTAAAVIEATRGVGTAFGAWPFTVTTSGRYQVFADDLEFPAQFAGLDAVITRGPDVIGSFFGGGSFIFTATPGTYFINFIARPGATSGGAGTYRLRIANAPSLPTVTLTADPARVGTGGTTRLTWSSTNATQCAASGAWSGNKASSGNETTVALSTQSTFSIECTGPGGASSAQLIVNVDAPSGNGGGGGGGGGALDEEWLALLLAVLALHLGARSRRALARG